MENVKRNIKAMTIRLSLIYVAFIFIQIQVMLYFCCFSLKNQLKFVII